jgi:hypothetical protein
MNHKWNAEKVFKYWLSKNMLGQRCEIDLSYYLIVSFYKEGDSIPIAELEVAVIKAAKIVSDLGINYIDIFERAERELKQAKNRINTIERIHRITNNKSSLNLKNDLIEP